MGTTDPTPNAMPKPQPAPDTTIGELRKLYGEHFANGYGDTDQWGQVSGRAGVTTVEEYIAQGKNL